MKKQYEDAKLAVVLFQDVIITSGEEQTEPFEAYNDMN